MEPETASPPAVGPLGAPTPDPRPPATAAYTPGMRRRGVARRWAPDVVGLAWTVLAVVAVMAPLLRPGVFLGSYDLLSRIGLTHRAGVAVHSQFPADQVLYFLPLTNLAWHQVHQGHLPLWNPDNVLGVPLAFSWQPAVFSVPVLLSYLVPVHYAYTVIVLAKLVIAGTGVYALCRVLGLGPLAAAFGGTVFELSGPMVHYSGWAMTGVTCWAGWILSAVVLVVRGRHRRRDGALLALAVAAAVYGGHPESLVVLAVSLAVFVAVSLAVRSRTPGAPLRRPTLDLALAGACGLGLGAPLLLPGLQVVQVSGRAGASGGAAYGPLHLSDLLTGLQGTDFRVPSPYVGVVAVVLAVVGVRLLWRRAELLALAGVALVGVVLTFRSPLYSVIQGAPGLGQVTWNRDVMLLALALAVLGAAGLDAVVGGLHPVELRRWTLGAFAGAGVVVAAVCLAVGVGAQHTSGGGARARLAWAAAEVVAGASLVAWAGAGRRVAGGDRARRWAAGGLVGLQSVVLVLSGVSFWCISTTAFSPTPAVRALQRAVGSSVVGIDTCEPRPFGAPYSPGSTEVGIRPNANLAYGVHEFAVYEPALLASYFASWTAASGEQVRNSLRRVGLFCPQITTVAEARLYGVSYLLLPRHSAGPVGARRDGSVGDEELFRVPGAAPATLSPAPARGGALPADAPGTPVAVDHPGPAAWRVVTAAATTQVLRLRVSASPGWSATIDGRPLPLGRWASGLMLEAAVPPGHHVVELHYWPASFSAGIGLAAAIAVGFALGSLALAARARRGARGGGDDDATAARRGQ
jgi:hypothetical protein